MKHTFIRCTPYMPKLTKDDASFSMNSIYHFSPCIYLLLIIYPWAMWEPSLKKTKTK